MVPARETAVICMDPAIAHDVLPDRLRLRLGEAVELLPDLRPADLSGGPVRSAARDALAQAGVIVSGWGCPPLEAPVLEAAPRLRAVVHAAGSLRQLITAPAWERGLVVSSAADANAEPVAEFTCALIVMAGKGAWRASDNYRQGLWDGGPREGCDGRVVGVIGASRVGRRVVDRLTRSRAGYRVLLTDLYTTAEAASALGAELVSLDERCRRSSIVSVHAPELPGTRNLLDAGRLSLVPDGGTVINTARGSLVDTDALARECLTGRLNACLDVTSPEPLPASHPLFSLPNVFVAPHVAGAQGSEVARLGEYAVEEVRRFVRGREIAR